jgi:hypothetical protein
MAICPRCSVSVPAFSRCDGCGLMLGYDGLTVLIECDGSSAMESARKVARRQPSYCEHQEENGRRFLRVTFKLSQLEEYNRLVEAAAGLTRRHAFVNGLEVPWMRLSADELPTARSSRAGSKARSHATRA